MLKILLRHTALGTWYAARIAVLFVIVSMAAGVAFLQFSILPGIERFHGDIELAASAAIGRPLKIERIRADWDGWRASLLLTGVSIRDDQRRVALELPSMRNTVAWSSLLFAELRFHSLQLDNPQLLIRRDVSGRLYVGGIESDPQSSLASDAATADWLLHQTLIVVKAGQIVWRDDLRGAPPVALKQIGLAVENRFDRHRFTLHATPPPLLAAPLELSGDLVGDTFSDADNWRGKLSARISRADIAAARVWLELPLRLQQGRGDLEVSLNLARGSVVRMDSAVDLRDVRAQLGPELPVLALRNIRGRLGWERLRNGFEFVANDFSLRMNDGFVLSRTDFLLNWNARDGYRSASGEVRANTLNLADAQHLLDYVPLQTQVKQQVAELGLQGRVAGLQASWQGDYEKLLRYRIRARFENVSMRQNGKLPGFSGLSGSVDGNDNDGVLSLDSRRFGLQAPDFLAEPLQFDRLSGRLDWQHSARRGWDFKLNDIRVENADLAGVIFGAYQFSDGPGIADLTASFNRVSVPHAARYIPLHAFGEATYHWLHTGLQAGVADKLQVRVRGNLSDFPFADDKNGLFKLTAKASYLAIQFDPDWPRIEQAQANFLIHGSLLEVKAGRAVTAGAALQNVRVALPDTLAGKGLMMVVDGEAADETRRTIDYVRHSPLNAYLGGYADEFKARGTGLLKLHLEIPLGHRAPTRVNGSYRIDDNVFDLGPSVPELQQVSGTVSFSDETIRSDNLTAQILGGPARVNVRGGDGVLTVRADGRLDADVLRKDYAYSLLQRLHGQTGWQAEIDVRDKVAEVRVSSDLLGLAADLPRPFNKAPDERIKLRFEQKTGAEGKTNLTLRYGEIFAANLLRSAGADGAGEIRRGTIVLGRAENVPKRDGIWILGRLPHLDLQGWSGWSELPRREGMLPNIAGIDVTFEQIAGFGNRVRDLNIRGSGRNGLISTRLTSPQINGDLIWQPQDQGKLLVRLKQLKLGESGGAPSLTVVAPPEAAPSAGAVSMPVIDMAVENLSWKGRSLGKLELLLEAEAADMVLKSLRLTNQDGLAEASGRWRTAENKTQIDVRIEITDSGKLLGRSGYPDSVAGAKGVFESALTWPGAPYEFTYPGLFGSVRVKVGKGRFLQVDPGAGKLLGVLSLQAIPKRISLDFTDIFSPGFQFDSIAGLALIENGMLKTEDFTMQGTAAKVTLKGEVDLQRETQQLQVRVYPALGDSVSLLSFAAGPVVGVGVLLASKLLRNPLDKLVAFDYNVSGSWADPVVERVAPNPPPAAE